MKYTLKEQECIARAFDDYFELWDINPKSDCFVQDTMDLNEKLLDIEDELAEISPALASKPVELPWQLLCYANRLAGGNVGLYPMAAIMASCAVLYSEGEEVEREALGFFIKLGGLFGDIMPAPQHVSRCIGFHQRVFRTYYCAARLNPLDTNLGERLYEMVDCSLKSLLSLDVDIYAREMIQAAEMADVIPQTRHILLTHLTSVIETVCDDIGKENSDKENLSEKLAIMTSAAACLANGVGIKNSLFYPLARLFEMAWVGLYRVDPDSGVRMLAYYTDNRDDNMVVLPEFAKMTLKMTQDIDNLAALLKSAIPQRSAPNALINTTSITPFQKLAPRG